MIVTFEQTYLRQLYTDGKASDKHHRFQPQIISKYIKVINLMKQLENVLGLVKYGSLHYEKLHSDKEGLSSVRINDQYRIEFTEGMDFGIELEETAVPVRPEVRAACDMLGLDPLYCANEGKLICICSPDDAERLVKVMRSCPEGRDAVIIGHVAEDLSGRVVLRTGLGGRRILQKLAGAQLPRIC